MRKLLKEIDNMMTPRLGIAAAVALLAVSSASAHVTLERQEAPIGGPYKAVFRVPHGCGASPTVKLRVRIPDHVIAVKPMPKPGWQIDTVKAKYDKTYTMFHSVTVAEGVNEVTFTGRLPDDNYDEFVLSVYLTDDLKPGSVLYFPVVQECESGVHRWIEIPESGKDAHDYKEPAPGLTLLPKR
jgi:periplasmic copper chaperone A